MEIFNPYKSIYRKLSEYCHAYGGIFSLIKSPYFHFSLLFNIILYNNWSNIGWWNDPIGILPNIIGFSLGSFAIIVAFGDERFQQILSACKNENAHSMMKSLSATFVHFILFQLLGLIFAIVGKSFHFYADLSSLKVKLNLYDYTYQDATVLFNASFSFLGHLIFLYSLFLIVAATIAIFRMCTWYEKFKEHENSNKSTSE